MKPTHVVCSTVLSISLLIGSAWAGETGASPTTPPPPVTTVKKAHVQRAEKNTAPLTVFDLLSMMLSNLGIL